MLKGALFNIRVSSDLHVLPVDQRDTADAFSS